MSYSNMKSLFVLVVLGSLLIYPTSSVANGKWYEGGSLHKASVSEWRSAPYGNKLATAGDWALINDAIKDKVIKSGSIDTAKPYAAKLAACVSKAAGPSGYDNAKVSELAATCQILLGW